MISSVVDRKISYINFMVKYGGADVILQPESDVANQGYDLIFLNTRGECVFIKLIIGDI